MNDNPYNAPAIRTTVKNEPERRHVVRNSEIKPPAIGMPEMVLIIVVLAVLVVTSLNR